MKSSPTSPAPGDTALPRLGPHRRGPRSAWRNSCAATTRPSHTSTPPRTTGPRSPPGPWRAQLVSHNDPNLDNIIFRDGRAVALIDFDLASPGSRLWDVACAARLWVPLRPDAYITDARRGRAFQRLRLFVDSYGLDRVERSRILSAVQQNQRWFFELVEWHIAAGHRAFLQYKKAETRMPPAEYASWLSENQEIARATLGL